MAAGSCGAIQGAKRAKITKMRTSTAPVAASGLWLAVTAIERRNEMAVVDKLACGTSADNKSSRSYFGGAVSTAIVGGFGVSPHPPPSESLAGRAVRKTCLQNLDGK